MAPRGYHTNMGNILYRGKRSELAVLGSWEGSAKQPLKPFAGNVVVISAIIEQKNECGY